MRAAAHPPGGTGPSSGRCRWWGCRSWASRPQCGPPAMAVANPDRVSFVALARRLAARRTTGAPGRDLGVDVAGLRDHRRPSLELAPGLDEALVEVLEQLAHDPLRALAVELGVELGVLLAQRERRREDTGDLLALDQLLHPPVRVVLGAQPLGRLARAAQVVEVAPGHRHAHLLVDPGLLVLDPGLGSATAG